MFGEEFSEGGRKRKDFVTEVNLGTGLGNLSPCESSESETKTRPNNKDFA